MTTDVVLVPASHVPSLWSPEQRALMEFAGLAWPVGQGDQKTVGYAPEGVVQAFIQTVHRSGLDPFAKQIYAAQIGGKWTILAGIDGLRLVAQRTGHYLGQTPVEYTDGELDPKTDDYVWRSAWLDGKVPPAAARVGVKKRGESDPTYMVATWAEFGKQSWKMPSHMLGIRAESHALRKAFPMEMSGLYTPEDFEAGQGDAIEPTEDWATLIDTAESKDALKRIVDRAKNLNEMNDELRRAALLKHGTFNAETVVTLDPAHPDDIAPEADQ